jgi:DNA-binding response OmpR family regulator
MKILVIEDNRDIAANLAEYFEPLGHILDFAEDGLEGVRLATSESFDAIVLDVMLPGLDGFGVAKKLRQEHGVNTPIIMLTARDQLDDKLEGFASGVDDYLVKPFSIKELEARLLILDKHGPFKNTDGLLQVGNLEFDPTTFDTKRDGINLELNPIQRKLLHYLIRHTDRVVTREELETVVWGDDIPDKDILRSHIYSLRNIIDKPFPYPLLHTIHGTGFRLHKD